MPTHKQVHLFEAKSADTRISRDEPGGRARELLAREWYPEQITGGSLSQTEYPTRAATRRDAPC